MSNEPPDYPNERVQTLARELLALTPEEPVDRAELTAAILAADSDQELHDAVAALEVFDAANSEL
jgi:hypothetical protein